MGRWYILVLISLMYLITYLDRVNISTAAPVISKEFGFDKITMGVIFSAFVWAYALFQVPGGWIGIRSMSAASCKASPTARAASVQ
jgi:sugar phosphate permease